MPIENLRAFYQRYYQPDNAVLVVAGKIDPAKTLGLVEKYYGAIPRPKRQLSRGYTVEPVQDGRIYIELINDRSCSRTREIPPSTARA